LLSRLRDLHSRILTSLPLTRARQIGNSRVRESKKGLVHEIR
jgi:hypothetical protein